MRIGIALGLATFALAALAHAGELVVPEHAIEGRYIVVLHDNEPTIARWGVDAGVNARALSCDPRIRFIEQDSTVRVSTTQTNAPWGLDRIDQRDPPQDGLYTYTLTGAGVHAYVIDTGIRSTHAEFTGRVAGGFTAVNDGRGTEDCNGHGSHVSGTIGGTTFGVAKEVTLHPVRVLGCTGAGTNSGVIAGVDWVTANHVKPAVANMSLGGGISTALDNAVRNSIAAGVVYALAAGNSNANACLSSPARVTQALTVGASTNTDSRASFSNFGPCVDLFAPGQGIVSVGLANDTATATLSGTSMASPHAAGAAALALQSSPNATAAEIAQTVVNNATPDKLSAVGTGSPNRLLFANAAVDPPLPVDAVPVAAFTFSCSGLSCAFDARGATDDAGITAFGWSFGDGQSGDGNLLEHQFGSGGTFTVVLTVTDTAGQTDTETASVTVNDPNSPTAPCTKCERFAGALEGTGAQAFQPNGTYYQAVSGTHRGWLAGPPDADFDVELWRWNGVAWAVVARSAGNTSAEGVVFAGSAGFYSWRVFPFRGGGNYEFWLQQP